MIALQNSSKNTFFGLLIALFLFPAFTAEAQIIRSRHDSKVSQFAEAAAIGMQKQICPMSGSDAYASINQWIYDEYQDHYEISLSLNWSGKTSFFGDRQNFWVSGILTVSSNGRKSSFKERSTNSAVREARTNNNIAAGVVFAGILLAADSQN